MSWLIDAVRWFFNNFFWSVQAILKPIVYLIGQILGLVLDGALTVVSGVLSTLDLGEIAVNAASAWGNLDPTIAWLINASGVSAGLSMLGTAYLIRFVLNLIPAEFTRV